MKNLATWDAAKAASVGTVFVDEYEDGLRFVILRGPCSLCAYVGVPFTHPLAGHHYDSVPVSAHGGLTFSDSGNREMGLDEAFYWYGWDYAHAGDKAMFEENFTDRSDEKRWNVQEVFDDSWNARWDFRKLLALAESIAKKSGVAQS